MDIEEIIEDIVDILDMSEMETEIQNYSRRGE